MKKNLGVLFGSVLGFMPLMALAQGTTSGGCNSVGFSYTTIQTILCNIGDILNTAVPILIILAVLYFIYGVIMFVISSDEESKTKGRTAMIYGIIGLVVIVAMWGLVGIVTNTFGINKNTGIVPNLVPEY